MIKNSPNFGLISTPFCVLISLPFSLWLSRFKLFICIIPPLEHYFTHSHQVGLHFSTTITNSPYSVPQDLSPRSPLILSFLLFALLFRCFAPLLSKESEINRQKGCQPRVFDLQPDQLFPLRSYRLID
ncbi:hypothetical protein SDJN02_11028, partial [Cucurbita argyrosperma subsp. argyrosperma]